MGTDLHIDALLTRARAWSSSHRLSSFHELLCFWPPHVNNSPCLAWSCDPPILESPLTSEARADIRCRIAKNWKEQGCPSCPGMLSLSFVLCSFPHNRKGPWSMLPNQWSIPNLSYSISPTIFDTVVSFICFDILLPLAFGRQQCPNFSSILLSSFTSLLVPFSFLNAGELLAHFLSLVFFPFFFFQFPCVYSPFSIFAHSSGC